MIFFLKRKIIFFILLFALLGNYAFADVKAEIYSKLKCCDCKMALGPCSCPEAKEMKTYIDALLEVGLTKDEVLLKVAKKYSLDHIVDKDLKEKIKEKLIDEAGPNRPNIFIKPLSFELGKISKGKGELKVVAKLQNRGKGTLTISDLKTSCVCTTAQVKTKGAVSPVAKDKWSDSKWKIDVASGEKAELIIVTDLNHPHVKVGHMLRMIEIRNNDPINSLMKVEVEAEIVE